MTLTTKAEHEKAREKKESEAWSRCELCDEYVHEQEGEKYIGVWFCDRWCVEEFIEELMYNFNVVKRIVGLSDEAELDQTVEKVREICEELKLREDGYDR